MKARPLGPFCLDPHVGDGYLIQTTLLQYRQPQRSMSMKGFDGKVFPTHGLLPMWGETAPY